MVAISKNIYLIANTIFRNKRYGFS